VLQLPVKARAGTACSPTARRCGASTPGLPAYINDDVLADVGRACPGGPLTDSPTPLEGQPRWINLWRRTDPIGGHIDTRGIGDRAVGRASVPCPHPAPRPYRTPALRPHIRRRTDGPTAGGGRPEPGGGTAVVRSKPVAPTRAPHCADVRFIDPTGFDPCRATECPRDPGALGLPALARFRRRGAALITRLPD
jgi:hypothetical protein